MADAKIIPAVEARVHLGEIMKRAFKKGERFIVEKAGIPMIAILNADEYARVIQEREERFKIFDKIRAKVPDMPAKEVENDVSKAIQSVRRKHA
ncbi:MAG: type II toxin-antitoxin system Phd/YefM family antitoxin [Candidatus Omnitrophica bacterium]|nr:type II toxin-antitoxin system Phd/YefM family antitoxin [Candidatus Omnitrophota bacterium]